MVPSPAAFEKLGAFYLGRQYDLSADKVGDELVMYDSRDLTTHAVCLGMTGSGKTGLCISLLEEAALDGIPAIAIDLKGDIANLLLTFPNLAASDFSPWIDPLVAAQQGLSAAELAAKTAQLWRDGLAQWGQDGRRIAALKQAVETAIFTPGSDAGIQLALLRSLDVPPETIMSDTDRLTDHVEATVSGLLTLANLPGDLLQSREQTFVSNLVHHAWRERKALSLERLIAMVQRPPMQKLGALDIDTFFPSADRARLAMRLNNILASPKIAAWSAGAPLDIHQLLYTREGRPRLSIISVAHLDQRERVFFLATLFNAVIGWMRTQSGTSSLRALLYMDEVFGYFPPSAEPPTKKPMLTLLKQARAYGLGIVLATQNPVDLDYKGLSNAGTWFLGRLQTERDKARVLDGLEGIATGGNNNFNRAELERTLSSLTSRVFLLNNVHERAPVIFHTRWAMSYLRGPLTRDQIRILMPPDDHSTPATNDRSPPNNEQRQPDTPIESTQYLNEHPPLPDGIDAAYRKADRTLDRSIVYRPSYYQCAQLHFVDRKANLDRWQTVAISAPLSSDTDRLASDEIVLEYDPADPTDELSQSALPNAQHTELPPLFLRKTALKAAQGHAKNHLYRAGQYTLRFSPELKLYAEPHEDEMAFRLRLRQHIRETRDEAISKLRDSYAKKMTRLSQKMATAEDRVEKEQLQVTDATSQTALSIGATLLGALFGRKVASVSNVRGVASTARKAGRISKEKTDLNRARGALDQLEKELESLQQALSLDLEALRTKFDPESATISEKAVRPRKADITLERPTLVWVPWHKTAANRWESIAV